MDLPTTWFLLIGVLLAGYTILDGFDLGVGTLHLFLAKDDRERRTSLNAIGPVWDGNEVWLLTGGGALFAAFPPVYATVFSGFYIPLMLLLGALIVRAVSLEFRSKEASPRWRQGWDVAFAVSSALPALLLGVALGNLLRGVPLDAEGEYAGTFFTLLNPFALVVGLGGLALFVMQGACWLHLKTSGALKERAGAAAFRGWIAFVALWAGAGLYSLGAAPHLWKAYHHPLTWIAPGVFLAALFGVPVLLKAGRAGGAFLASSVVIAALWGIIGQGLFPNMVPALGDATRSLTIHNASSTPLTLRTMLVIALAGMPFVVGYTIFIYSRFRGPVVLDDKSY
jgi:cytochrome d ubiquinol oxidase subunit II